MEELQAEKFFRSDDMSLVTYLKLQGHTAQQVAWVNETCYWWFLMTDALVGDVQSFGARDGRVEPREFSRAFATTRKDFFDSQESR